VDLSVCIYPVVGKWHLRVRTDNEADWDWICSFCLSRTIEGWERMSFGVRVLGEGTFRQRMGGPTECILRIYSLSRLASFHICHRLLFPVRNPRQHVNLEIHDSPSPFLTSHLLSLSPLPSASSSPLKDVTGWTSKLKAGLQKHALQTTTHCPPPHSEKDSYPHHPSFPNNIP
jgi:hypothetical protein